MGGGVRGGAWGTRDGLSGGSERHRQGSWPDDSWQAQYADLHRSILAGSSPAGARRYLVWTCGTTFREPGCDLRSRACNCVGYANRLLGLASAFLAAIITSRAFLIAWPGEEAVHLHNFFHSDLIDWRTTDEVMNRLGMPASLEFVQHDWAKHDLLQLLNGEYGEVLLMGAEKGDFLDIFRHGHHAEHLADLGLSHVDEAMSLLSLLLQPSGALKAAVNAMQEKIFPCHVIGIQVRIAKEARSMLQCTGGPQWPKFLTPHLDKEMLTYTDLPRFITAAVLMEEAAMEKGAECVKWLLITDEPLVVKWFSDGAGGRTELEKRRFQERLIYFDGGPIAHMSHSDDSRGHLKVMVDHWMFATAQDAILSSPSSFGLTARAMRLSGERMEFAAVFSLLYHDAQVPHAARPVTELYKCFPHGTDNCFCGYWGFAGHVCDSNLSANPSANPSTTSGLQISEIVAFCPECGVMEFPMCKCEILRPPFCRTDLHLKFLSPSPGQEVVLHSQTRDTSSGISEGETLRTGADGAGGDVEEEEEEEEEAGARSGRGFGDVSTSHLARLGASGGGSGVGVEGGGGGGDNATIDHATCDSDRRLRVPDPGALNGGADVGGGDGAGGAGRREGVEQGTGKDVGVEYEKTVVGLGIYELPAVSMSAV